VPAFGAEEALLAGAAGWLELTRPVRNDFISSKNLLTFLGRLILLLLFHTALCFARYRAFGLCGRSWGSRVIGISGYGCI
jgi:hypothetical protein